MPNNKISEHHADAQKHYKNAEKKHGEAADAYKSGSHEKGALHAAAAHGSALQGKKSANDALEAHAKEHSDKK